MSVKRLKLGIVSAFVLLVPLVSGLQPAVADSEEPAVNISREKEERIQLLLSEQHVLPSSGVRSYSEGTRGVVDVRLTRKGDQFVLVGQRVGETTLLFIMEDGSERHFRIEVRDPSQKKRKSEELKVLRQDNIRLDFYFVQLIRSNNHQIGLGYPGSVSSGTLDASFDFLSQRFESATAVVEDQALLRLDMAQSAGWAKLMRKAAVITENGKKAEFSGGGEVNIPVQGSLTTGIHKIEFGSSIVVQPRYDSQSGRIQIELIAEVSDLTDDRGSGAPGRVTSTLSTIVNLELGQTVVLAGLTAESKLKSHTGVPGLSQIPIVGFLFGSEKLSQQESDNVVFIVPTVIDATTKDDREQVREAFELFRRFDGKRGDRESLQGTWRRDESAH